MLDACFPAVVKHVCVSILKMVSVHLSMQNAIRHDKHLLHFS